MDKRDFKETAPARQTPGEPSLHPLTRGFAFGKVNFILSAVGMAIVIIGFILMSGSGSSETVFNPDVFSVRRVKVAPIVCLFGFLFIIYAILWKPACTPSEEENERLMQKKDGMSGADATINED